MPLPAGHVALVAEARLGDLSLPFLAGAVQSLARGLPIRYTIVMYGGELGSTGQHEVEAACPGSKEAWLNTLGKTLIANSQLRMAA
jgi:hypothetical protein